MSHPNFSDEQVAQCGKELYDKQIRTQVETAENIGKIISLDIESGDYDIDDDLLTTCCRLQARHLIRFSGQKELDLTQFMQSVAR